MSAVVRCRKSRVNCREEQGICVSCLEEQYKLCQVSRGAEVVSAIAKSRRSCVSCREEQEKLCQLS